MALMVLSAGFFGGALLLYGIRHYDWSGIDLPNVPETVDSILET
jgi:hypothetical protein